MNLADFTKTYRDNFTAIGGNPDDCEGVVWTEAYISSYPEATISDFIRIVDAKIRSGSADHGWLLSSLRLNWSVLTENERLEYFSALSNGGVHKCLLNTSLFNEKLTVAEADLIEKLLAKSCSFKAIDRFRRERPNRVVSIARSANG